MILNNKNLIRYKITIKTWTIRKINWYRIIKSLCLLMVPKNILK